MIFSPKQDINARKEVLATIHCGNTHSSAMMWNTSDRQLPPTEMIFKNAGADSFIERGPGTICAWQTCARTLGYPFRGVLVSGVVPELTKEIIALLRSSAVDVRVFRKNVVPRLQIDPMPARSVGSDRIASALGALALDPHSNWIVIDLGTAMTVNAISPAHNGKPARFHGGAIVPGVATSLRALAEFTAQLPLLKPSDKAFTRFIGKSTREAMLVGTHQAQLAAAIALAKGQIAELGGSAKIALTGGGATPAFVLSFSKSFPKGSVTADRHLVHRGLLAAWTASA